MKRRIGRTVFDKITDLKTYARTSKRKTGKGIQKELNLYLSNRYGPRMIRKVKSGRQGNLE